MRWTAPSGRWTGARCTTREIGGSLSDIARTLRDTAESQRVSRSPNADWTARSAEDWQLLAQAVEDGLLDRLRAERAAVGMVDFS